MSVASDSLHPDSGHNQSWRADEQQFCGQVFEMAHHCYENAICFVWSEDGLLWRSNTFEDFVLHIYRSCEIVLRRPFQGGIIINAGTLSDTAVSPLEQTEIPSPPP